MNHPQKAITNAIEELGAILGISSGFWRQDEDIEDKDPVIEKTKDDPAMKAQTAVPFVDTNIIPDRNAGIGSLLWDLQNSQDPDWDGPPLLDPGLRLSMSAYPVPRCRPP